jgi:hypothetical protein
MSALPHMNDAPLITYTLFPDVSPVTKTERADIPWGVLVENIRKAPTYIAKGSCPLISIGEYGDLKSDKDCLRHAANVRRIFGVEIDYDGEQMPIEEAAAILQNAGICSVLYTSPSHTMQRPRWRVLLPLSEPAIPEKRKEYVGRVNRILGGVATRESFTLSQSFYLGRVRGAEYIVIETQGRYIDIAADIEPLYFVGGSNTGESARDATSDTELRACFVKGAGRYEAMLKLSSRWAARGMQSDDIETSLLELLGSGSVNHDGIDLRTRARPMAISAVAKFGESRPAPTSHFEKYEQAHEQREHKPEPAKAAVVAVDAVPQLPTAKSLISIVGTEAAHREWFFEEILPAGAFLIVGRPKVGKSWLLMQLAVCAAGCGDFLGFAALGKVGVLYVTPEDDLTRIKSRFSRFNIAPPDGLHIIERNDFATLAAEFSSRLTLVQFVDLYLTQHPTIKFVFLDTEGTCRHVWEGENSGSKEKAITKKDYAEVREFDTIALKHRAFIGLVNHTGKRKGTGAWADIHELINRTNTALAGASGSIVVADPPGHDPMDSDSRIRVLGIRGRDVTGDHLIAIQQRDDGAFESLGKWSDYCLTESQQQIVDALIEINEESAGQWITTKEVAQWIGKSPGGVKRAISRMTRAGLKTHSGYRFEVKKSQGVKLHKVGE